VHYTDVPLRRSINFLEQLMAEFSNRELIQEEVNVR
jgi:hypothetical protein